MILISRTGEEEPEHCSSLQTEEDVQHVHVKVQTGQAADKSHFLLERLEAGPD